MPKEAETIVLGLGAMGSAATYQLAKRGESVLGIDQFSPPHEQGSSHGDSRITRQAIGEGEEYVPLALRSYEIWNEIERETGKKLLHVTGGLILESQDSEVAPHGRFNFLKQTVDTANKYGIRHEVLEPNEIKSRFPQFNVTNERGYFEHEAGYLNPELCIEAQLELAERYGAGIHKNEKVLEVIPSDNNNGVTIKTDKAEYDADKLIIAAGPWIGRLLGNRYADFFKVYRQVMFWFAIDSEQAQNYTPENCPIYIWIFGKGGEFGFYGFPSIDGKTIKIAGEQFEITTTADSVDRQVSEDEKRDAYEKYLRDRLVGISDRCANAVTCLYTVTPDSDFVIDFDPNHPQVIIASPDSGHGFKHSAAIGEVLAELATEGKSKIDITKFSIARLRTDKST